MFDKIMDIDAQKVEDFSCELRTAVATHKTSKFQQLLANPILRYIDANEICHAAIAVCAAGRFRMLRKYGIIADNHDRLKKTAFECKHPILMLRVISGVYPEIRFNYKDVERIMKFTDETLMVALMNSKNIDAASCLYAAVSAECKNLELIKLLCNYCFSAEVTDNNGYSTLAFAITSENYDVLEILLTNCELDVSLSDLRNRTPLEYAVNKKDKHLIGLLLKHGAKTDAKLLANVVRSGELEIVKIFGEAGIDFNVGTSPSNTPVIVAAEMHRSDILEILIEYGADINHGAIFTESCGYGGQLGYFSSHVDFTGFKLLVDHGANMTAVHKNYTELMIGAIMKSREDFVRYMLKAGYPVDGIKRSPLLLAVTYKHLGIIEMLLKSGANVNMVATNGRTALHMVCVYTYTNDKYTTVKMLLDHGIDTTIIDKVGKTAYEYLRDSDAKTKELLEKHELSLKTPPPPPPPMPSKKVSKVTSKKSPSPAPLCDVPITVPAPFDEADQLRKEIKALQKSFNSLMVQMESVEDLVLRLKTN